MEPDKGLDFVIHDHLTREKNWGLNSHERRVLWLLLKRRARQLSASQHGCRGLPKHLPSCILRPIRWYNNQDVVLSIC
jgi:hypothetical protein